MSNIENLPEEEYERLRELGFFDEETEDKLKDDLTEYLKEKAEKNKSTIDRLYNNLSFSSQLNLIACSPRIQ